MKELLEALDAATNVKSITYNKDNKEWVVNFHSGESNILNSELLIEFLENA